MRCVWCHNPETYSLNPQIQWNSSNCTNCLDCAPICEPGTRSILSENLNLDFSKCTSCGNCERVCNFGASEIIGKEYSIETLIDEVSSDGIYYEQSGGGITLSGGEPFFQFDFIFELVKKMKEEKFHVCIETNLSQSWTKVEKLIPYVDLFLCDLKIFSDEKHKKYTGISNRMILENFKKLDISGANFEVRIPIIPNMNDDDSEIAKLANFVSKLRNLSNLKLLPYHSFGEGKFESLGQQKSYKSDIHINDKLLEHFYGLFEQKLKA